MPGIAINSRAVFGRAAAIAWSTLSLHTRDAGTRRLFASPRRHARRDSTIRFSAPLTVAARAPLPGAGFFLDFFDLRFPEASGVALIVRSIASLVDAAPAEVSL